MKKIILLLAITLSLNANTLMCKISTDGYLKNYKLLKFAYERKNVFDIRWHANRTVINLEKVIVECNLTAAQMKEALKQRKVLMEILKSIKGGQRER